MYRALARFAQRWQGMLQAGRFVAGAGERRAAPTRRRVKRRYARPSAGATSAARGGPQGAMRAQKRMPYSLAGRRTTWCVSPGPRAAWTIRLTSDSGPPISTSAGTSRSPMCELTTSVSDVMSSVSAKRLTAQMESWPSTSRNGSRGGGAGPGGGRARRRLGPRRSVGRRGDEQSEPAARADARSRLNVGRLRRAAAVPAELDIGTGAVSVAWKGDETWAFDHEAFT